MEKIPHNILQKCRREADEIQWHRWHELIGWRVQQPQGSRATFESEIKKACVTKPGTPTTLREIIRAAIAKAVKDCGGNKVAAARQLKCSAPTIYDNLAKAVVALCLSFSVANAQRGTGTTLSPIAPSPSPAVTMFAPALAVVAPPTPKTNLFYNVGPTWDIEVNPLITGYRIRYGTNTAALTNSLTTTNTFCTISNLAFKQTWYFQAATLWGTNQSEWSYTVQVQPPIESGFVLSTVFPLYTSTNGVNWITNKVVTLTQTNPPGNMFFRSHFRQLDFQWTNNQIRLKPFSIP